MEVVRPATSSSAVRPSGGVVELDGAAWPTDQAPIADKATGPVIRSASQSQTRPRAFASAGRGPISGAGATNRRSLSCSCLPASGSGPQCTADCETVVDCGAEAGLVHLGNGTFVVDSEERDLAVCVRLGGKVHDRLAGADDGPGG